VSCLVPSLGNLWSMVLINNLLLLSNMRNAMNRWCEFKHCRSVLFPSGVISSHLLLLSCFSADFAGTVSRFSNSVDGCLDVTMGDAEQLHFDPLELDRLTALTHGHALTRWVLIHRSACTDTLVHDHLLLHTSGNFHPGIRKLLHLASGVVDDYPTAAVYDGDQIGGDQEHHELHVTHHLTRRPEPGGLSARRTICDLGAPIRSVISLIRDFTFLSADQVLL